MDDRERKQLNREIAEALGYRVGSAEYYNPGGEYNAPAVLKPDGTPVQLYKDVGFGAISLDEQWLKIPDYAGDLNAVADALGSYAMLSVQDYGAETGCLSAVTVDNPDDPDNQRFFDGEGVTVQVAAARALLEWAKQGGWG